ncbi:hypothetical protein HYDPIDRAFT_187193 [Hydnomerulius pinastri MD-312]|nr:hypothetical protein HYDPIDRAFT_187193 [Hydnomerulius pinastri MD-312]
MSLATAGSSQSPRVDWRAHQVSHRVRHIPCGRCDAVIEHDSRARWSMVNNLVNRHWEVCPGKPHVPPARAPQLARAPSPSAWVPIALSATAGPDQSRTPEPSGELPAVQKTTWVTSGWERKRKTEVQRKLELEEDQYASNVTATSVVCLGCHKEISLDKRSRYYPGLWIKHRGKCPDIEKLERARRGRTAPLLNGQSRRPTEIVASSLPHDKLVDGSGDHRTEEQASHLNRAEESERYHDTAVSGNQLSDNWSDISSSDEDEDEANLLHVPFPTINGTYYRQCNRSEEWIYRYATKDEIFTNLYRSQSA